MLERWRQLHPESACCRTSPHRESFHLAAAFRSVEVGAEWAVFVFAEVPLAAVGLPSTSGFVGEFLILLGAFKANTLATFLATTGVVLGAAYMLWLYRRVALGEIMHDDVKTMPDVSGREITFFVPVMLLVLWIGLYPKPYFSAMEASVAQLVKQSAEGAK